MEYGPGSYFIQVSECEWIQFKDKLYWAKFKYDGSDDKVFYLWRKEFKVEILENKFNIYELNGQQSKFSATVKAEWKNLSEPCQDYKSGIQIIPPPFNTSLCIHFLIIY